jgi:HPt (histidine-containing phosphotransfer) domain-containing protein
MISDKGADMRVIIVTVKKELAALIPRFLDNRKLDISSMKTALESNELGAIKSIGHKLKGSGGGYGFDALSALGANIEMAANDGDVEMLRTLLAEYEDYMRRVEVRWE